MKRLFTLLSATLMTLATATAQADDHEAPATIVGFVYNFNVSNPAGVVEALTEYWNSPTGKKNPATAILRQHVSNGDDPSTHSIAVVYSSPAQIDETNALNNGSEDGLKFFAKMTASATLVSEAMFFSTGVTSGNPAIVPAPGRYTINTGIAVSDADAYVGAWQEYISALDGSSSATNLFVLNGTGEQKSTHAVTVSANSMADLFPQDPSGQEAYAKLVSAVKDIRTVESRSIYVDLAVFSN